MTLLVSVSHIVVLNTDCAQLPAREICEMFVIQASDGSNDTSKKLVSTESQQVPLNQQFLTLTLRSIGKEILSHEMVL